MTPIASSLTGTATATTGAAQAGHAADAKKKDEAAEVKQAAAAFQAILVRQMLSSSAVAGKGGYSDMGVEALATAVTSGGGLGLGQAIERAIGHDKHAPPVETSVAKKKTEGP